MASGMEAPRSMAEVVVVLSSREQTKTRGSQPSKLQSLLGICSAMTAEVVGVCVHTGIVDVVQHKNLWIWEMRVSAAGDGVCPSVVVVCVDPRWHESPRLRFSRIDVFGTCSRGW